VASILLVIFSFPVQGNSANTYQQELINELHKQLTKTVGNRKQPVLDRSRLRIFYESRNFQPVWLDYKGPLPRAAVLRQVLNAAGDEGLEYEIYHPDKITALWHKRLPWNLAELELLLSDALLRYSEHVQTGYRVPHIGEYYWDLPQPEVDALRVLDNLLKTNDLMAILLELAPDHEGYRRLRNALKYYREIELQGGWSPIPPGPALQLGVWHEHVSLLRERLVAEGDLELGPVTHVNYYDQAIKFAVERFQVRYGLKLDGVVGAGTRAAMNVPVSERIEQIKLNMERWRWLPRKLGQRYIMVNTAGYELAVVDNNKTAFTMEVMVGTPKRPTPIAKGRLHTIVLNPYWTLPETIIYEDIIPRQIRNKNYIKSKGIRVFSNLSRGKEIDPAKVDWTEIKPGHFPYVLRQDPGKKNPLGRIKFLFSNVHDVYLHDTPKQSLFDKDNRAFSSGCVRVARPMQLASYLLDDKNDWSEAEIKESIDAGEYRKIPVSGRIPVYLVYMTAWVGENNGVHFRPDIYQWDPKVAKCDEFP
jgi:murein L,D-transpeptidase YcbB/YkuD